MKSKKSTLCLIPVVMLVLAIIIAWSGQQAVAATDWENVVAAAKKEGSLTVYGRFPKATVAAMEKVWKSKYPEIKVNLVALGGTQLLERVKVEQASKNIECDLVLAPDSQQWQFQDLKILASTYPGKVLPNLNDPSIPWKDKPWTDDNIMNGFMYALFGMAINTKLVPPEREPKSWMDLTDPWFKGKVAILNPSAGTGLSWYLCLWKSLGVDFHKKLGANNPIISAMGSEEIPALVAAGEYAVQIPAKYEIYLKMPKEAPIKMMYPKEGIRGSVTSASIVKNARHPNAALVFMNFLLSKEMQEAIAIVGRPSARLDAATPYPEIKKANNVPWIRFDKDLFMSNRKNLSKEAKEIYGLK